MTGNAVALQRPAAVGPPISFLYLHFHNCIRGELDGLATSIRQLEAAQDAADVHERLLLLKERYGFLEQIYSYHSSVEDEVRLHDAQDAWARQHVHTPSCMTCRLCCRQTGWGAGVAVQCCGLPAQTRQQPGSWAVPGGNPTWPLNLPKNPA